MLASSLFFDLCTVIPVPETETLLGALFGGVLCGIGIGLVFMGHASTGGSDIIARLLKCKFRNLKIGRLLLFVDLTVVTLTGIVFRDISKTLYSVVVLYVSTEVMDAILYGLDYSVVAIIISTTRSMPPSTVISTAARPSLTAAAATPAPPSQSS